ncbi:hypothetical protein [Chryseobacterium aureum]|uniref:hypothetical protein n=1 Tax=Chryseobacterium aureum TaxID=2497456 RepID=UPI000F869AA1|nr:hypothetical protein [Chryseobacterium aureum]
MFGKYNNKYKGILKDWKKEDIQGGLVTREYTVIKRLPVRDGIVGPLRDGQAIDLSGANSLDELQEFERLLKTDLIYKGGEHQFEFIENLRGDEWKKYFNENNIKTYDLE